MRSTKLRIRASITAGLALSAVVLLAATGGTVAQVTDTISAKVDLAVEGTPYGIARGVSAAFHYQAASGSPDNADQRYSSVNSLTAPDRTNPANFDTPWNYTSGDSGLRLLAAPNVTSCASSSRDGNTNRCPIDALPADAIVSASSGNLPSTRKTDIDFRDNALQWSIWPSDFFTDIRIHDIWTSVSCTSDGAYAAAPQANFDFGGMSSNYAGQRQRTGWFALPSPNHYRTVQQWASTTQNPSQTVEVQSIQKTFEKPTRAISAIVVYATSANGTNPISDFSFVAKSECAISEDGTVELSDSSTFGPITPPLKRLATPAWANNYTRTLETGEVTDFSHVANVQSTLGRSGQKSQSNEEGIGRAQSLTEESTIKQEDLPNSETTATSEGETTTPSSSSPNASAPATVNTPASTSPAPMATQTTTSGGPTPSTSASISEPATSGYTTITGQSYSSATGGTFTRSQRELVEEAIAAAQSAESGELTDGAKYTTTSNQLDGTTLIVTTADGSTLRIVWEK